MREESLDGVDKAFKNFEDKMKKYLAYLHFLETQVKMERLTEREKEMLEKHGRKKREAEKK